MSFPTAVHFGGIMKFQGLILKHNFMCFPTLWKKIYEDVFEAAAKVTTGNGDTLSITVFIG